MCYAQISQGVQKMEFAHFSKTNTRMPMQCWQRIRFLCCMILAGIYTQFVSSFLVFTLIFHNLIMTKVSG